MGRKDHSIHSILDGLKEATEFLDYLVRFNWRGFNFSKNQNGFLFLSYALQKTLKERVKLYGQEKYLGEEGVKKKTKSVF